MDWTLRVAFLGVVRLVSWLPLGGARRLFRWLSIVPSTLNSNAAQITRTNLRLCFPTSSPAEIRALSRASLAQTACIIAETGVLFHWPQQRWLALAPQPRAQALHQALAANRGVLVLVPHYGNWEYLALYLGQFGVTGLYEPPRTRSLEAPLRAARERSGISMLPVDGAGLRGAYRHLQAGGCLALLPDQVPRRSAGVYAPFFGVPALTMNLAHRLIQRTRPTVLLGVAQRTQSGFDVSFVAFDEPWGDGIYSPSAEVSAGALNTAIEAVVRRDPAQYQWEYRRFRRPPAGTPDPYGR